MVDIVYLADRKNAPYGTKNEYDLLHLVEDCIDRLASYGAQRILMACCTASTAWERLTEEKRSISVPIIRYAADALSGDEKTVLVIATERTVADGAFREAVKKKCPNAHIVQVPMQSLVLAVENGARGGNMEKATRCEIETIRHLAEEHRPDALILGCTHFSSVAELIKDAVPSMRLVNPAHLGAMAMVNDVARLGINTRERGKIIYM
jgi:glutamate racemase